LSVGASGPGLAYQWRHGGQPIPGATGPVLTIQPVAPADEGVYDVRVSNTCGTVTSDPVTLVICDVDLDCSGGITVVDFLSFLSLFAQGDARADFDHSGAVNVADLGVFLQRYATACQ
jgi:hypothetical protein